MSTRAELERWVTHLDALAVDRDELVELPEKSLDLVTFRDPDGIALEAIWHGH